MHRLVTVHGASLRRFCGMIRKGGEGTRILDESTKVAEQNQDSFYRHFRSGESTQSAAQPPSNGSLHLSDIAAHSFYCKDSRAQDANFGAPGGDFGEFLLAFSVCADLLGRAVLGAEVAHVFSAWVAEHCSATRPFYLHSDRAALGRLFASQAQLRALQDCSPQHLQDAPSRAAFLSALTGADAPGFHGCGHLRLLQEQPEQYGIRIDLLHELLRAFFRAYWAERDSHQPPRLLFQIYEGPIAAAGIVIIYGPDDLAKSLLATQSSAHEQLFILNQHATRLFRRDHLAPFFARHLRCDAAQLFAAMEQKGWENGGRTADALATGIPIYRVDLVRQ